MGIWRQTHAPVIGESRNITELGQVVASEDGLTTLRETRDLESSFIAAGGPRDRLLRRLTNAHNNLEAAHDDYAAHCEDDEVKILLSRCQQSIQRLAEIHVDN